MIAVGVEFKVTHCTLKIGILKAARTKLSQHDTAAAVKEYAA